MAASRIYIARLDGAKGEDCSVRLVRAPNVAQVGRHIASAWAIKPASAEDVARFRDTTIEDAVERTDVVDTTMPLPGV